MHDICPIMSIGQDEYVDCTFKCAWYDKHMDECAISRINGNSKLLEDVNKAIEGVSLSVSQLDDTVTKGIGKLISNL